MKKLISILVLMISSNCVLGQLWNYPNLPGGFELLGYKCNDNSKIGIKSETIIITREKDTLHYEKSYYDSLGRQIKRIFKDDTLLYEYNSEGLLVGKFSSSLGKEIRSLEYNEKGQLITLTVLFNLDTTDYILYTYNPNFELPVKVEFENGYSQERTYYEDGKLRSLKFFQESALTESLTYFYSGDTISYSDCYENDEKGQRTCETTYGIHDKNGRIIRVVSQERKGRNSGSLKAKYKYNKKGKLIKFFYWLSDGTSEKLFYYYDSNDLMVKSETFSQGKKMTTIVYTNIEKR